jgi:flagellar biosynthesis protein FlhA
MDKLTGVQRHSDVILAIGVVGMVLLLVIPLPPVLLDLLLSLSIVIAVTTLLITLYTEDTLQFAAFPSLLLFVTVFRLGLNIASTRMILSDGHAGDIIKTFGEFVTGGSQVVGLIIFILLTVINFVVITKGSGRVAECQSMPISMLESSMNKRLRLVARESLLKLTFTVLWMVHLSLCVEMPLQALLLH